MKFFPTSLSFLATLILATLGFTGCATSRAVEEPAEAPRRGWISRSFDLFRGNPDRIEHAGRKNTNRLTVQLKVAPEEVNLSETRRLQVEAVISNPTRRALSLHFPTTQRLEIVIEDTSANAVVARWSEDRLFAQTMGHMAINPSERVEFKEPISVRDLSAGRPYRVVFSVPGYPQLTATWSFTPR